MRRCNREDAPNGLRGGQPRALVGIVSKRKVELRIVHEVELRHHFACQGRRLEQFPLAVDYGLLRRKGRDDAAKIGDVGASRIDEQRRFRRVARRNGKDVRPQRQHHKDSRQGHRSPTTKDRRRDATHIQIMRGPIAIIQLIC